MYSWLDFLPMFRHCDHELLFAELVAASCHSHSRLVHYCSATQSSQGASTMLRFDSTRNVAHHIFPHCRNNHFPINFTFSVAAGLSRLLGYNLWLLIILNMHPRLLSIIHPYLFNSKRVYCLQWNPLTCLLFALLGLSVPLSKINYVAFSGSLIFRKE